ncbi:MAG: hypothetical protein A2288_02010 [Candidatus Moranbacteria bacterium RIFOXYA12_FULL_44_15]|nr:MAG: hypothetical protein A2288_02010 [Candidatus Moranbacteria bacterium RIFOXYA12_FULL_44_15]OGI35448.1 MAG: hypothetical protein A2259_02365 [Candidatus Moranbacteria bacterium RIFOXYA2_FULL_43_15]
MLYQKQQELEDARRRDEEKKTGETLKKYNTGKNKGQAKNIINEAKNAKNLIKSATPGGFLSLLFQISIFSDWMFGLAIFAAVLKDLVDFTGLGSFPGIGTVITFCISIFIGFMMLLGSFTSGTGRVQHKVIRSWLILIAGTTAELLFGLNFLPIETLTALFVYMLVLAERKGGKETQKQPSAQESYA